MSSQPDLSSIAANPMTPSNPSMLAPPSQLQQPPQQQQQQQPQQHSSSHRGNYTIMTSRASSRSGRWTPDEKLLFLYGLKLYGRGRWKKIRQFLPTRTLIQIKSHAQKVLKRDEAGDDVFSPLQANKDKVDALLKDKSRLFHRDSPATLMSSDGRYHTITLMTHHAQQQQQQQQLQQQTPQPMQPQQQQQQQQQQSQPQGYVNPYYNKTTSTTTAISEYTHPLSSSSENRPPPDPQQRPQPSPPSQQHTTVMMPQQLYHPHRNGINGGVNGGGGGQNHHHHHPSSSPQSQTASGSHPMTQPIVPQHVTQPSNIGALVPVTGINDDATPHHHHHHHHHVPPKAATDALAAAALCELFRGEGKELEQVSV